MDPLAYALVAAGVTLAGFLRGFTGFGFALGAVPILTLVLPPGAVVPLISLLQVVSCLPTAIRERTVVDWRVVGFLSLGAAAGIVPGLMVLTWLSPDTIRAGIGLLVLVAVLVLHYGWHPNISVTPTAAAATGVVAGTLQGAAGMAGPPVIVFLMAKQEADPREVRASLAAFFLIVGIIALLGTAQAHLFTTQTVMFALGSLPAMFFGQWVGGYLFARTDSANYRRSALILLSLIGAGAIVAAIH